MSVSARGSFHTLFSAFKARGRRRAPPSERRPRNSSHWSLQSLLCCLLPSRNRQRRQSGLGRTVRTSVHRLLSLLPALTFYRNLFEFFWGLNQESLLPAISPLDEGRKCLVLDLDETLVHSSFKPVPNPDFVVPIEIDGQVSLIGTWPPMVYIYSYRGVFSPILVP